MCYDLRLIESIARSNSRSGACEDSAELCAPYIGILPDESETADGSPLDFGGGHGEWFHFTPGDGGKAAFWEGRDKARDEARSMARRAKARATLATCETEFARWFRRYPHASGAAILAKLKQASK
jgi:hypothetical protein